MMLKRSKCSVLPLVLKTEWYRMIEYGFKREEYRDASAFWKTRLMNWAWFKRGNARWLVVAFSLGYRKSTMFFLAKPFPFVPDLPLLHAYYTRGDRHPEWGEPENGHWHFVIKLGERVELVEEPEATP